MIRLIFPPKCVLCNRILERDQQDLCPGCRKDAQRYPNKRTHFPHLAKVTGLWYYKDTVRLSILRYKFWGRIAYVRSYGRLLARLLAEQNAEFDILTWVPVSLPRLWKRGYDQSKLLARQLGKELGTVPVKTLKKIRHTKAQSLSGDAPHRRANILGAYRCTCPEEIKGKRILLVDDILTTGATGSECARTLITAGAKQVSLAVLAVADHTKQQ